ncbi:hypothetical protein POKO110462_19885 [Pontibacter korlensis]
MRKDRNYRNHALYLARTLGRKASRAELINFKGNQDLLLINRRSPANDAYCVYFVNDTSVQLLTDGMLLGGSIQLHSQEEAPRLYNIMLEGQGTVEEHYLMLDASVESAVVGGVRTTLVQMVRLITIEDLVLQHSPIMYNLT